MLQPSKLIFTIVTNSIDFFFSFPPSSSARNLLFLDLGLKKDKNAIQLYNLESMAYYLNFDLIVKWYESLHAVDRWSLLLGFVCIVTYLSWKLDDGTEIGSEGGDFWGSDSWDNDS